MLAVADLDATLPCTALNFLGTVLDDLDKYQKAERLTSEGLMGCKTLGRAFQLASTSRGNILPYFKLDDS